MLNIFLILRTIRITPLYLHLLPPVLAMHGRLVAVAWTRYVIYVYVYNQLIFFRLPRSQPAIQLLIILHARLLKHIATAISWEL